MNSIDIDLNSSVIRQIVEHTENNTAIRTYVLQALSLFLGYFEIVDYDKLIQSYKAQNTPRIKKRNVPSDETIKDVFKTGFNPSLNANKRMLRRYPQWKFLYGLLATYGLRIHEAWNIANWDKPVMLNQGDWVAVEINLNGDDRYEQYKGSNTVIPAILDPNNKDKILCIKHTTKTGYRMAMPISPTGENWLEEFNLIQPLNLPDTKDPLELATVGGSLNCTNQTCQWFKKRNYGFTPHDLRHAYNHRGHHLGYNATLLSNSLGHSLQLNSSTYLKTMPDTRKMLMMKEAIASEKEKQSELEILKAEVEFLALPYLVC
jgi:integrase